MDTAVRKLASINKWDADLNAMQAVLRFHRCLERSVIPSSALRFQFGAMPSDIDPEYYNARLAEASSVYFVNLVVMYAPPLPP